MKSFYLAAALSLTAFPALAQQQPTPADIFEQHWGDTVTASRVFDMMTRSLAESAAPLVKAYREQAAELKASEARLSTAMEWLKAAQEKNQ